MEIWIPVIVAIVSGVLSFLASTTSTNKEIKKIKIENESQMQRMKEQHRDELERLEKENHLEIDRMKSEFELKIAEYSKTKETDVQYDFMQTMLTEAIRNPEKAKSYFSGLTSLAEEAKKYKSKNE